MGKSQRPEHGPRDYFRVACDSEGIFGAREFDGDWTGCYLPRLDPSGCIGRRCLSGSTRVRKWSIGIG